MDHPGRQSWDMVSGAAKYPTDLWMEGTLTAMALRCPYGHAKVKSLDTQSEKIEGVKLVLTYEDEELASMPKYRPSYYEFGGSRCWATRPSSRATKWASSWWP